MSVGMILLAVWLILQGLPLIVRFVIPNRSWECSRCLRES